MGFVIGSSSFLQHPLLQFTSCTCALTSPSYRRGGSGALPKGVHRKAAKRKVAVLAVASLQGDGGEGGSSRLQRRTLLLVGISSLPLLQFRAAAAAEDLVREKQAFPLTKVKETDAQKAETTLGNPQVKESQAEIVPSSFLQMRPPEAPQNPFLAILNAVGILGSGVIGALYASSQKDKASLESTVESLTSQINEKETAMKLLKDNFEKKISSEQEERKKQVRKLREEENAILKKLASANATVAALGQELRSEKGTIEQLTLQLDELQDCLGEANGDNKVLEGKLQEKNCEIDVLHDKISLLSLEIEDKEKNINKLKSSICEKELECKSLRSIIGETQADYQNATAAAEHLEMELQQVKEELVIKNSSIGDLNEKVKSLSNERDGISKKFHSLLEDFEKLKSDSSEKTELDSKLLSQKEQQIKQLEENLGLAYRDLKDSHALIFSLKQEGETTNSALEEEILKVKELRNKLQIAQGSLEALNIEASSLSNLLSESGKERERLEMDISKTKADSSEAQKLLEEKLDTATSTSKLLSDELVSVKGILKRTKEELDDTSTELSVVLEARESLEKELVEVYKKFENIKSELKEEKKMVDVLKGELEASNEQVEKGSEGIQSLQQELKEATKSLDEVNKQVSSLSRELEDAQLKTASLAEEKEMLYKSLVQQSNVAKEVEENIEDAQNLIMRLGEEREKLEKRVRKLEEELAAAKGEILRQRMQNGLNKVPRTELPNIDNGAEATASVVTKKSGGRRRRAVNSPDTSQ